jgi:hypothetical protein
VWKFEVKSRLEERYVDWLGHAGARGRQLAKYLTNVTTSGFAGICPIFLLNSQFYSSWKASDTAKPLKTEKKCSIVVF